VPHAAAYADLASLKRSDTRSLRRARETCEDLCCFSGSASGNRSVSPCWRGPAVSYPLAHHHLDCRQFGIERRALGSQGLAALGAHAVGICGGSERPVGSCMAGKGVGVRAPTEPPARTEGLNHENSKM
jgi:hypothetical protein